MKFMVCYDGSEASKYALKIALNHAKVWDAQLQVVKAITRVEPLKHTRVKKKEQELESEINKFIGDVDVPLETQLMLTDLEPGEQIVASAKEDEVDQIFLGIQKKSKVGKLIFGSTAQYIILNASCPVITVQ